MQLTIGQQYPVFNYNKSIEITEVMEFVSFCSQIIGGYACISSRFPVFKGEEYHIASVSASLNTEENRYVFTITSFKRAATLAELFNYGNDKYVGIMP